VESYYFGLVEYRGQEFQGRHEPLVTPELFESVQRMLELRRAGGVRERTHNHYLKGAVSCARCQRRLIVERGKSKTGALHSYYFCRSARPETTAAPPFWAVPLRVRVRTLSWRCRESNPGPSLLCQGFSERSSLCLYSAPPIT
jgi:hypothetical protein